MSKESNMQRELTDQELAELEAAGRQADDVTGLSEEKVAQLRRLEGAYILVEREAALALVAEVRRRRAEQGEAV